MNENPIPETDLALGIMFALLLRAQQTWESSWQSFSAPGGPCDNTLPCSLIFSIHTVTSTQRATSCDMWPSQTPKVSTTLNTSSPECNEILQSDTAAHSGDWQKQREQRGSGEKMLVRKEKQSKKLKRAD